MSNQSDKPSLPVTDRTPRPGDFPVGSPASRAAARALLRRKDDDDQVVLTVRFTSLGEDGEVEEVYQMASGKVYGRRGRIFGQNGIDWNWNMANPPADDPFWRIYGNHEE
jgi:hypothetical protein